jgi:hypothetical protein
MHADGNHPSPPDISAPCFERIFQPHSGLAAGLALSGVYALVVLLMCEGDQERYYLTYFVPIGVPFVGFLFERARSYARQSSLPVPLLALDAAVVVLALARAVYHLPFISGHALFLGYALLTVRSWWVRVPAALVLIEVIYFKIFLWDDPTLYGGLLVAALAALVWSRLSHHLHK